MEIDVTELLWTALRASFVYLFLLLVVRLLGKREIGNTSAFDLVLAHILVTFGSSRSTRFYRLVTSPERILIEKCKLVQKSLPREWLRPDTVHSELRVSGEEHPREVQEAWLEPKGKVSVVKRPSSQPVKKKAKRLLG